MCSKISISVFTLCEMFITVIILNNLNYFSTGNFRLRFIESSVLAEVNLY